VRQLNLSNCLKTNLERDVRIWGEKHSSKSLMRYIAKYRVEYVVFILLQQNINGENKK